MNKVEIRDFLRMFLAALLGAVASKIFDIAFGRPILDQFVIMFGFLIFAGLLYLVAHWIKL